MGLLGRIFGRSEQRVSGEAPKVEAMTFALMPNVSARVPVAVPLPLPVQNGTRSVDAYTSEDVERVVLPSGNFSVCDLTEVQAVRARIVGSGYWVTTQERTIYGGMEYLLVREPRNKYDKNAIAIYGKSRKVGYVTTSKAAAMSELLDTMGYDRYRIGGAGVDPSSSRLWADLPSIPELRRFAKEHGAQ